MQRKLDEFIKKLQQNQYTSQLEKLAQALDKSFIEGPSVQIDPGLQTDIQDAVAELRKVDPGFFKGVSKIVGYTGGEFGKVESTDPTIIHVNLQKIKQKVQQDLGAQYKPSDPAHQKVFKEALKRSLVETISHEKAHVKDWSQEQHKFLGGEGVAESAEKAMIQKLHYDKPIEASTNLLNKFALLVQRVNPKTDRKEWALVSREDRRPLKYFGPTKPSKETVEKEEKRIQYFKHQASYSIDSDPSYQKLKKKEARQKIEQEIQKLSRGFPVLKTIAIRVEQSLANQNNWDNQAIVKFASEKSSNNLFPYIASLLDLMNKFRSRYQADDLRSLDFFEKCYIMIEKYRDLIEKEWDFLLEDIDSIYQVLLKIEKELPKAQQMSPLELERKVVELSQASDFIEKEKAKIYRSKLLYLLPSLAIEELTKFAFSSDRLIRLAAEKLVESKQKLSRKAQVGQEQSSHLDGVDLYNLTGNEGPAGGASFKPSSTRQQVLVKLKEKLKKNKQSK